MSYGHAGTFEIVRMPASYIISRSGHGNRAKTVYYLISANYSNAKKEVSGVCHMKADVRPVLELSLIHI